MLGQPVDREELLASRGRLAERLEDLRRLTLDELAFVGETEPEERLELERIARFEALLEQAVTTISQAGPGAAPQTLRRDMEALDREFGALIDEVIEDELGEAAAADAQARRVTARLTTLAISWSSLVGHLRRGHGAMGAPADPGADRRLDRGHPKDRARRARPPGQRLGPRRAREPSGELQLDGGRTRTAASRAGPLACGSRAQGRGANQGAAAEQPDPEPRGPRPAPHVRRHQPCLAHAA